MLYTAKCYWPGISAEEFDRGASGRLATRSAEPGSIVYCGAILFPEDDLVLCLFEASSRAAVKEAAERARVPCERVIASVWLPAPDRASSNAHEAFEQDAVRPQRRNH
jgi:Nickel responsive protein SCO4226-like